MTHDDGTDSIPGGAWGGALSDHRQRQSHHILGAAMAVMARDGVAGLTMSAIAEEASVSRQTLYKYFPDVDSVLLGLTEVAGSIEGDLAVRIEAADDAASGLRVFAEEALAAGASGHPSSISLAAIVSPEVRARLSAHSASAEAAVIGVVARGLREGTFRGDLDPELDGRIIYRTVMAAHDLAAAPGQDVARLLAHVNEIVLRSVQAPTT